MNSKAIQRLEKIIRQWRIATAELERAEKREREIRETYTRVCSETVRQNVPALNPPGWNNLAGD
jgi:hypothetical protein